MIGQNAGSISQWIGNIPASLVRNAIHPLWARHTHPNYARYMRAFEVTQFLSPKDLRQLQTRRLREQLIHAYHYVPFYRMRMTQAGLTPLDIQNADDMHLLPVLTKPEIQANADWMLATNIPANQRERSQTRGTTGMPLDFYVDRERFDSRMASINRHNAWAGLRVGDWYAHLWGSRTKATAQAHRKLGLRETIVGRNLSLNSTSATEEDLLGYVQLLRRYRPKYLVAYAQSATLFAQFCREQKFEDIKFLSVIVTAEALMDGERALIEETFKGKVFNRYGCREVSIIASECEYHTGLHINADALLVEVEPSPELPQGMGRVLVTDLLNRSMPLIRYETGDLASVSPTTECPCGRSLPLLGNIEGRVADLLREPEDRLLSGPELTRVISDLHEVHQVQFLQSDSFHATLKVVTGPEYGLRAEQELRRRLKPYLREQVSLTIVTTDYIGQENSGKYRNVKTSRDLSSVASGTH